MLRLAIMQPYFFPYQGYFQLAHSVDRFVIYDDVAFIKNGWINRNRLLAAGGPQYFTIPLFNASSFRSIRETQCAPARLWRDKMMRTLGQVYARAPERDAGLGIVERTLRCAESQSICDLAVASIREVCDYAKISPSWQRSSSSYDNQHLSGVERILDICRRECATSYVNPPGGRALYDAATFRAHGIALEFLVPSLEAYPQPGQSSFVPGLSVLDLIMRVSRQEVEVRLAAGQTSP